MLKSKVIQFIEKSGTNLTEGIFSYIQEQINAKDLDANGTVSFTTNRATNKTVPLNLIDKERTYWASGKYLDSYLLIDFKKNKVAVSDYIITNYGFDFSREWKLHGSNDKRKWYELSHETTNFPSTDDTFYTFVYHSKSLERFRYLKFTQQQGRVHQDGSHLVFYEIELYGVFYSSSDIHYKTCFRRVNHLSLIRLPFVILISN
jgi:hypothetical protein